MLPPFRRNEQGVHPRMVCVRGCASHTLPMVSEDGRACPPKDPHMSEIRYKPCSITFLHAQPTMNRCLSFFTCLHIDSVACYGVVHLLPILVRLLLFLEKKSHRISSPRSKCTVHMSEDYPFVML